GRRATRSARSLRVPAEPADRAFPVCFPHRRTLVVAPSIGGRWMPALLRAAVAGRLGLAAVEWPGGESMRTENPTTPATALVARIGAQLARARRSVWARGP